MSPRRARLEGKIVTDHLDDSTPEEVSDVEPNTAATEPETAFPEDAPQYGVGPFSIREVAIGGVWLLAFIVSFFSVSALRFDSVWTGGLQWILTIGVPTVAVFLIGLRRLSPEGIRRVGSLGIDQFASVAFSVSTVIWLGYLWETISIVSQGGPWVRTWVMWVEFFLMLAGVFLTVFAPFIAPFDEDFAGRAEVPAHRNARPIRAVSPRPARVVPAPAAPAAAAPAPADEPAAAPQAFADWAAPTAASVAVAEAEPATSEPVATDEVTDTPTQVMAQEPAVESAPRHQAFWALAPEDRDVVDEAGTPLFRVGPTAWALVIEERVDVFVVRDEDGRIGYLHDISGVIRG